MMGFILVVFALICIASLVILTIEINNAKTVDSKEPFLYGDYDSKNESIHL